MLAFALCRRIQYNFDNLVAYAVGYEQLGYTQHQLWHHAQRCTQLAAQYREQLHALKRAVVLAEQQKQQQIATLIDTVLQHYTAHYNAQLNALQYSCEQLSDTIAEQHTQITALHSKNDTLLARCAVQLTRYHKLCSAVQQLQHKVAAVKQSQQSAAKQCSDTVVVIGNTVNELTSELKRVLQQYKALQDKFNAQGEKLIQHEEYSARAEQSVIMAENRATVCSICVSIVHSTATSCASTAMV